MPTDTEIFRKNVSTRSTKDKVWKFRRDTDDYRNINKDDTDFGSEEVDHVVELQVVRDAFDRLQAHKSDKQAIVKGLKDECVNVPQNLNVTSMVINRSKRWAIDDYLKSYANDSPKGLVTLLNKHGEDKWTRSDTGRITREIWDSHHKIVDLLPNAVSSAASTAAEEYLDILQDMIVNMQLK